MNAWEEPVEVRIAAAQAHMLQRMLEGRKTGEQPGPERAGTREPAQ